MKNKRINKRTTLTGQRGVSMPEVLVAFFVVAIIVVLAMPQVISSRRASRFSGLQRQVVGALREAQQEAISQRMPITFRYADGDKKIIIYGGSFGAAGTDKNRSVAIAGEDLQPNEILYGRPAGAPVSALADSANLTSLSADAVEIVFQADGSVVDSDNIPVNKAIFFYHSKNPAQTAFAISILGAGGRAKIWHYSSTANAYIE
jgi:Tfp pilus assembly protein FimT